ncbi:kinase-like protein [Fragilariopsis cylindrus CCMP1102]|uniref:non-specific serine/threonine protein kinase n=1 Tax=Fragilariopsis cylindrus CCMP1102 TaxID=635003 RepID=A0A1E7F6X4_9STRA|nr:kinase-like protein [Fragilariopsis cylindrus CCMP1102]|eukprot:OEU13907.1 kinase-like protein [Fragilariopsis cylindrus CCMP1102]
MLPLEAQSSHGVGLIDGTIPLIQYTRYASEFEEIGALGKGGFGSVFQCRNALDKRDYAIKKVLIRCDAKLPQIEFSRRLKRTLREVKSLASLDHSNIVRYYTAWLELEQANHNDNNHSVTSTSQRYILYIQMQFCSQKTLADFLSNEEARKGPSGSSIGGVDIPYALNLFLQTCQGVKHVHTQCLIHRDLKPNNVFIDDTGAVKVGDFGLSRESSDNSGESEAETALTGAENYSYNGDITAGVGTRSYASPEQMKGGSDYDSSTDIYSLGIILFELCFPMYTGMERNIVLTKLRNHILPDQWMESVAVDFPKLHTLLLSMISNKPEDRPDAAAVVRTVQSILEGFTISSLDRRDYEGSILLRVETLFRENGLHQTMDLLRQAALPVLIDIVQYGLRSGTNQGEMKSIMEFAIVPRPQQEEKDATKCSPSSIGELLVKTLSDNPQVLLIRQVSATKYT